MNYNKIGSLDKIIMLNMFYIIKIAQRAQVYTAVGGSKFFLSV